MAPSWRSLGVALLATWRPTRRLCPEHLARPHSAVWPCRRTTCPRSTRSSSRGATSARKDSARGRGDAYELLYRPWAVGPPRGLGAGAALCLNVFGALVAVKTCHSAHNNSFRNLCSRIRVKKFRWIFPLRCRVGDLSIWQLQRAVLDCFADPRRRPVAESTKDRPSTGGAGRSASTPARVVPVASRPPAPRRIHAPSPALKQAKKKWSPSLG